MKAELFSAIEKGLNHYLSLDPESVRRVHALQGKTVAIHWRTSFPLPTFFLFFQDEKISVREESSEKADIIIQGTPLSLLRMSVSQEKKAFFSDDVSIEGNLELGQQVIDLFDQLEIDWEEHLSRCVGDVPAHHIGSAFQRVKNISQRVRASLLRNVNEYVHEEVDLFPPAEALQDFFAEVDVMRMDVDRLEARVEKLKRGME